MTPSLVVDASAIAAILFAEAEAPPVMARVAGHALLAPPLIVAELANIAWKKVRRQQLTAAEAMAQLAELDAFAIALHPVDATAALDVALATGLTAYDAGYLWLARDRGVALVTLDTRLAETAA